MSKYKYNKDYFNKIDTADKAYWLGFLYADGCVTQNKDHTIIDLSIVDYAHLLLFRDCVESNNNIRFKNHSNRLFIITRRGGNSTCLIIILTK